MAVEEILLLALFVVPGLVFYWSVYAALKVSFQRKSFLELIALSGIGGTMVLLIWAGIPLLTSEILVQTNNPSFLADLMDWLTLTSLLGRVLGSETLVEGLLTWQNLLHYFGVLVSAVALGFGLIWGLRATYTSQTPLAKSLIEGLEVIMPGLRRLLSQGHDGTKAVSQSGGRKPQKKRR